MTRIEIIVGTTYATTTGTGQTYIPLPDNEADIAYIPTTQYLYGVDKGQAVNIKSWKTTGVTINKKAVKYNKLTLSYTCVGDIVRA